MKEEGARIQVPLKGDRAAVEKGQNHLSTLHSISSDSGGRPAPPSGLRHLQQSVSMVAWGKHMGIRLHFLTVSRSLKLCFCFLTSQAGVIHAVVRLGVKLHILYLVHGEHWATATICPSCRRWGSGGFGAVGAQMSFSHFPQPLPQPLASILCLLFFWTHLETLALRNPLAELQGHGAHPVLSNAQGSWGWFPGDTALLRAVWLVGRGLREFEGWSFIWASASAAVRTSPGKYSYGTVNMARPKALDTSSHHLSSEYRESHLGRCQGTGVAWPTKGHAAEDIEGWMAAGLQAWWGGSRVRILKECRS